MQPEALRLGLIGYPLGHSLSRELHMAALTSANLPGEYLLYPVPPLPFGEAELASMMLKLRSGEIHGVNITIPHKQSLLASMDMLSSVASEVQAINTIAYDQGKLIGWNTDVQGFLADLARSAPGLISPEPGFSECRGRKEVCADFRCRRFRTSSCVCIETGRVSGLRCCQTFRTSSCFT